MAFAMGDVAPVGMGGLGNNWIGSLLSGVSNMVGPVSKFGKEMGKVGKDLGKAMSPNVHKSAESMRKAFKDKERVKGMGEMFSMIGGMATGPINVLMSFMDKLGVFGPILDVLNGLMSILSGAIMEELAPSFEELFSVLFSEEMLTLLGNLGASIGEFLSGIMIFIADLFSNSAFLTVLETFEVIFTNFFFILTEVLGWLFNILNVMSPQELGALFYALGIGLAFMIGLLTGGVAGVILGAIFAGIAAFALAPLLFIPAMQHGGYVPATTGGQTIRVSEGGEGEHVVPESQMREMLWATEDNGKKLERIHTALVNSGRLR